jgi:eukaryotic-like serine/threonine-protein kinase
MTPQRWQAIGELFDEALAVPTVERTALIDRVCGNDDVVRREVRSLLASHDAAGGFVQKRIDAALASFHQTTDIPTLARVGPYRLVRELGRGGMGTVFLAERDDDQYQAKVAIKLVRPGMDTEFILARFRRERVTLARLQHPNICHLFDGGTTNDGLPYIVMEFIDGPWITTYAAQHKLSIEARLRLFLQICSAVDYAHRNFVIHRDLKPGNILVAAGGAPKLLDFGICRLLVEPSDTVAAPLTPNYASPEQVQGEAATVLSDIYSLGAVLYELLTGTAPRRFDNQSPLKIQEALDKRIVRPSAVVTDARLSRQLAGDLDNILMRALDAEPARRYESAAQLASDLRRHLRHVPIRARPHTLGYRAMSFVRRNRGATAAVAAVIVTLIAGLAVSMYQARLADARLDQVRTLASKLVFDVHDAVRDLPGSTEARRMIVQTGLHYLDDLAAASRHDPRAETELARAYRRLGDVQGNVEAANLGDLPGALAQYQKALPLLDDAIRQNSKDVDARTEQLVVNNRIARLQIETGKLRDALQTFQDAIARAAVAQASNQPELRLALADAYLGASNAQRSLGDDRGAVKAATEGLRLYREAAAASGSSPAVMRELAAAQAELGMGQMRLGQLALALDRFREGTATLETLVASDPRNVNLNRALMLAYGHIADVLGNPDMNSLGDREGALRAYRQAADVGKRLYEADRSDQRAASDYGIVLSRVETAMDDHDPEKLSVQRESLRVLDEAARISPKNLTLQIYRALVHLHLGETLSANRQLDEARLAYLESAAISEPYLARGHASLFVMFMRANLRLALNASGLARRADALKFAERAFRTSEKPPTDAPSTRARPRGLSAMGLTYAALLNSPVRDPGDREHAVSWLRQAADAWHAAQSDPAFAAPHRREMREVEDALARLERR